MTARLRLGLSLISLRRVEKISAASVACPEQQLFGLVCLGESPRMGADLAAGRLGPQGERSQLACEAQYLEESTDAVCEVDGVGVVGVEVGAGRRVTGWACLARRSLWRVAGCWNPRCRGRSLLGSSGGGGHR